MLKDDSLRKKDYFSGHKDAITINEYLNALPEDSVEFLGVYLLRKMGERFVDGTLTLEDVRNERLTLKGVSPEAEAFIKKMKCWTFYSALCNIADDKPLSPLELKIKNEIEHPSWIGEAESIWKKTKRWWYTRWKHPLVYNEWWFPALITTVWCWLRRENLVKA